MVVNNQNNGDQPPQMGGENIADNPPPAYCVNQNVIVPVQQYAIPVQRPIVHQSPVPDVMSPVPSQSNRNDVINNNNNNNHIDDHHNNEDVGIQLNGHLYQNHVYQLDMEDTNNNMQAININNIYSNPMEFLVNHTLINEAMTNQRNSNNNNQIVIGTNSFLNALSTPLGSMNTYTNQLLTKRALKDREKVLKALDKLQRERDRSECKRQKKEAKEARKTKAKSKPPRMARSGAGGQAGGAGRRGGAEDPLMSRPRRRNKKDKQVQKK